MIPLSESKKKQPTSSHKPESKRLKFVNSNYIFKIYKKTEKLCIVVVDHRD